LPGGNFGHAEVEARIDELQRRYSFLKPQHVRRLFRAYGTLTAEVLGDARFAADLGRSFGTLTEREIEYLKREEWAQTADDILWRRSKLGLHLSRSEQDDLHEFMQPAPARKRPRVKA
jgi:glycerol-3-phosphate dehydrogenase